MAKNRMIDTKFWDDDYTSNLDPIEKLMFLYLLTNTSTNISGIYEIPLKKIALETGIDKEMVIKILDRFARDKRVFYSSGWICLKNFIKHQNQRSPTVIVGIKNEIANVPKDILSNFIGYGYPNVSNLTKSNLIQSNKREKDLSKEEKKKYGEFENVLLTDAEYAKLTLKFGDSLSSLIERLSSYVASKGRRYSSHYATLLTWSRREEEKTNNKGKSVAIIQ